MSADGPGFCPGFFLPGRRQGVHVQTKKILAAIAGGQSRNLIHRAADVMLKERRPLLLAMRDTPLNRIHLKNMLRAHDAGATICPTLPGFYLCPETLEEAADTFSWRLADMLGIDIANRVRWGD